MMTTNEEDQMDSVPVSMFRLNITDLVEETAITKDGKVIGTWVPNQMPQDRAEAARPDVLMADAGFGRSRPAPKPGK